MLDLNTEFGQRVARRLQEEGIIWFITIDGQARPQPRPVWFLWDGEAFLMYSRPTAHKLNHIRANPQVSLHFDGDGQGGDIIVVMGEAKIVTDGPLAHELAAYVEKYEWGFERINMTAEQFGTAYTAMIRVQPTAFRG